MKKSFTLLTIAVACCLAVQAQINRRNTLKSSPCKANYQCMAAGTYHTLEIRDGILWAWGRNLKGQLGDGTTVNKSSPVQIGADNKWVSIAAGEKCGSSC